MICLAVAACVPSEVLNEQFWETDEVSRVPATNAGLALLVKGDLAAADRLLGEALASNPKDAYALAAAGFVAEQAGDDRRARQLYTVIVGLNPPPTGMFMVPGEAVAGTVADIARIKLSQPTMTRNSVAGSAPTGQKSVAETADVMHDDGLSAPERNKITRFEILNRLLAEAFITPNEHAARRVANLGALLPLTQQPPAAGLGRPVPNADDLIGRMRAIGRAMAMGTIGPPQHAEERELILDALLPRKVRLAASAANPPRTDIDASAYFARLQAAIDADVISDVEYAAEFKAIQTAVRQAQSDQLSAVERAQSAAPAVAATEQAADLPVVLEPSEPGTSAEAAYVVHLASYRSREQASRGWAHLTRAYQGLIGTLEPRILEVDLASNGGHFFRLAAGPLAKKSAARALCTKLRAKHQYCQVMSL